MVMQTFSRTIFTANVMGICLNSFVSDFAKKKRTKKQRMYFSYDLFLEGLIAPSKQHKQLNERKQRYKSHQKKPTTIVMIPDHNFMTFILFTSCCESASCTVRFQEVQARNSCAATHRNNNNDDDGNLQCASAGYKHSIRPLQKQPTKS